MSPTTLENAIKIDKLDEKLRDKSESLVVVKTKTENIEIAVDSILKEQKLLSASMIQLTVAVDVLGQDVKDIGRQQSELSKFRIKIDGGKYIISAILALIVTISGLVWGWTEFQDRYVSKQDMPIEMILEQKNYKNLKEFCSQEENHDEHKCSNSAIGNSVP
jgi:hypothetical protein